MAAEVIMPKVDMDQETGTIMEWVKQAGESVEAGDTILVIETEKVAVDVEAPASGTLAGISAEVGEVVPIGTVIAYVLAEGEQVPLSPSSKGKATAEAPAKSSAEVEPPSGFIASPLARRMAAANGLDLGAIKPENTGRGITKDDVERALARSAAWQQQGKVYAVPAARRLAAINQVDLASLRGSGPGGRIQSSDVRREMERWAEEGLALAPAQSAGESIPLLGIRRTIAERMTQSYRTIPHIRLTIPVEMDAFSQTRAALNQRAQDQAGAKISATALMVKLIAAVLPRHPLLNSSLSDETILLHDEINIGVAVALENGLIVPVVRGVDQKEIGEIARHLNDLTARAQAGELTPTEVKGGTFTVSNLGPFGVEQFDALINPPEAAILAIGATKLEAIPSEGGSMSVRSVMRVTLSVDHRIVDGAVAARFLADLKTTFEAPPEFDAASG
jgi:pyruvate dehydrogenase E2 component (dihydrolipoamide acetyltransferase)